MQSSRLGSAPLRPRCRIVPFLSFIVCFFVCTDAKAAVCGYTYGQVEIDIRGTPVLTEVYTPDRPALGTVLMLHGSAGLYTASRNREPILDNFGEKSLAHGCYQVFLPHYFQALDRTSITSQTELEAEKPELLSTVDLILNEVESSSVRSRRPVFLYGESLGNGLRTWNKFQAEIGK